MNNDDSGLEFYDKVGSIEYGEYHRPQRPYLYQHMWVHPDWFKMDKFLYARYTDISLRMRLKFFFSSFLFNMNMNLDLPNLDGLSQTNLNFKTTLKFNFNIDTLSTQKK